MCKAEIFTLPRIGNIHVALTLSRLPLTYVRATIYTPSLWLDRKIDIKRLTQSTKPKRRLLFLIIKSKSTEPRNSLPSFAAKFVGLTAMPYLPFALSGI